MMAMAKKRKADGLKYTPRKTIPILLKGDDVEAHGRAHAESMTGGPLAAMRIIRASEKSAGYEDDLDFPTLLATLREQGEAVNAGNLAQPEAMLMNQATALQTLFARLAERGMSCTDAVPFEINMRIALRAQSQCRATLETLATIKNPSSVAFVRQANIAHGPQQVNNENSTRTHPRPRENEIAPSKLLEAEHGERLDTGTASAAGAANQELEGMGAIHGAANTRGQGQS
jgi:hypothetical protein